MDLAPGVGLAGPQVGVGKRLFVYSYTDDDEVLHRAAAVNPVLWISPPVPESVDELDEDDESEGCLSVPGERFPLRRSGSALLRVGAGGLAVPAGAPGTGSCQSGGRNRSAALGTLSTFSRVSVTSRTLAVMPGMSARSTLGVLTTTV